MKVLKILVMSLLMSLASIVQADVYELRTYTTHAGRLDALLDRFANHTMRIFEMHGIHNVAYWVPQDKPNTLIYIVSHPDRDRAAENWRAFASDPEWVQARADSVIDGEIVERVDSVYMETTPWSPMQ